jgi:hypothetical protein
MVGLCTRYPRVLLTADPGEWNEEPTSYEYQWQRCDSTGGDCANITGATGATYVPRASDVGLSVRVLVTAVNLAGSATSTSRSSEPIRYARPEPTCTTHWIGPADGNWSDPLNWSAAAIPDARDTACAPTGATISLGEGTAEVAALQDGGALQLTGGTLTLTSTTQSSTIGALTLEEATLTGAGALTITSALTWGNGGVMSGSGTTVIGAKATAVLRTPGYYPSYDENLPALITRRLVNEGTVRIEGGEGDPARAKSRGAALQMSEGARLENQGVLVDNSVGNAIGPVQGARGVAPAFVNEGVIHRRIGRQAFIAVPFGNQGRVELERGGLFIEGGGIAGEVSMGSWYDSPSESEAEEIFFDSQESLTPAPLLISSEASLANGVTWHPDNPPVRTPAGGPSAESAHPSTITGEPVVGESQSVSLGTWTGKEPIGYTYQWQICNLLGGECTNIEGAQEATYTPTGNDAGATLRVLVTGANLLASVTAPSQPSSIIGPPEPPTSTGAPVISGTTTAGQMLSASTGEWAGSQPLHYTYQWQSCSPAGSECTNIEGASEPSYTLAAGDVGTTVRVVVTATNSAGPASASSSASTVIAAAQPPVNDSAPTITGHANDGQNLIALQGVWSGSPSIEYGYRWESCNEHGQECAPIEGASEPEYELGDGDIGTTVRVKITATNAGGASEAYSPATAPIEGEAPSEQEPPSISGTPDADGVLSASPGVWTGSRQQLGYQWESCNEHGQECAPIEGASEPEYQLGSGDVGSTVRVRVGLHSLTASLTNVSQPTVVVGAAEALVSTTLPQIGSDPQVGSSVQADTGAWSSNRSLTYTFQWQRCGPFGGGCSNIEGATSETYASVAGDAGDALRVRVSASDAHESTAATSPASQPVAAAGAPTAEQPPMIEGTALEGQTLSASQGSWSSESPTSYTYQWERCDPATVCTAIEGATEASYTLTTGDVGASIVAVITARNRHGSATAVSRTSAIIQPTSLTQLSQPTLAGAVEVGGTLTATPGIWSGEGAISYDYQWETCGPGGSSCTPIEGATEETYTLPSAEQGSALRAKISITGPHGSQVLYSPTTVGTPGGEVTPTEAQEVAQQTDPALLAPATAAQLEGQTIAPTLADGEEQLAANATLTSATVSKENPAELAVNTPVGELSLTPTETLPTASTVPTIVNATAALFANTWPATDTIVRPEPLGANALLQVRSAEAPKTFT